MRPAEEGQGEEQLKHLTGGRFLACLWIVSAHFLPRSHEPSFNGALFRVNVAVCYFVVVSGFVTHWAYGSMDLSSAAALLLFYLRRLGRVVITFWVAMALACCTAAAAGNSLAFWYVVRCFLFVEQWVNWCPNGPSWFVFVLLPSWLLYPLTRRCVLCVERHYRDAGLLSLLLLLWLLSAGPGLGLLALQGGNITYQQHADMTYWPPAQMADFALGVTAAALTKRWRRDPGSELWELGLGRLADFSLLVVMVAVFLVPRPKTTYALHPNGWEPLFDHTLSIALAGHLVGSCAPVKVRSGSVKLLSHRGLVALGANSFEVYIFQRPIHDLFVGQFAANSDSMEVFMTFLLGLWLFAGLYAHYIQAPLNGWLRAAAEHFEDCQTQSEEEDSEETTLLEDSELLGGFTTRGPEGMR